VVLYSRPGCHLCERAEEALRRASRRRPFRWRVVDITQDPALLARYQFVVPVIEIDGRVAQVGKVSAYRLLRQLG